MADEKPVEVPVVAPVVVEPLPEPKEGPRINLLRMIRAAVVNVVLFVPRMFKGKKTVDEVMVYSAHPAFYLWFPILVGFIISPIVRHWPNTASFFGWVYIWSVVYFVLTLLYDFSVKKLSLWIGIIALIWFISKYVELVNNIIFLGSIVGYLKSLQPVLDPGTATVLSWLFVLPWIGSLLEMFFNRRKRFTPNEIGEFHFGEGAELTDRYGLRFRTKYRDVLEFLLGFGGGDILAVDNHGAVVKRYENIVGLFFIWNKLDKTLQQRATVTQLETETHDEQ